MFYNYEVECTKSHKLVNELKKVLSDLLCNTDKRIKSSKEIKNLLINLERFENFSFNKGEASNLEKRNTFEIEIDILLLESLHLIKEQSKQPTLSDTLNHFLKTYSNMLEVKHFIKIDNLITIENENEKIVNSVCIEKFIKKNELKILFSIDDIIVFKDKKYLNPINFFLLSKDEVDIETYVSENITFKNLDNFYEISNSRNFKYR